MREAVSGVDPELSVLVGGGSAMDAGKSVALVVRNPGDVFDYEDIGDNWTRADPSRIPPMIALPTTAGTGSEVGRAAVVSLVLVPAVRLRLVVGGLGGEEGRDVVEHEPFAVPVLERAAVAAHAFRDQDAAHAGGPDHARGMELHKLHVHQVRAHIERHGGAIAGVLPRVGGHFPSLAAAACGEDHSLALEEDKPAAFAPIAEGAADSAGVCQKPLQIALHENIDAPVHRVLLQGADHFEPGAVADMG